MNQHAYSDSVRLTGGTYRSKTVRASPQCELGPRQFTNSPYSCVALNHHFRLSAEPVAAGKALDHLEFNPLRKHESRQLYFYTTVNTGRTRCIFCSHNSGCGRGWTIDVSWFDSRQGQANIPAVLSNANRGTFTRTKAAAAWSRPLSQSGAKAKNGAIGTSTPPYAFMVW